jgi:hypothetical protein
MADPRKKSPTNKPVSRAVEPIEPDDDADDAALVQFRLSTIESRLDGVIDDTIRCVGQHSSQIDSLHVRLLKVEAAINMTRGRTTEAPSSLRVELDDARSELAKGREQLAEMIATHALELAGLQEVQRLTIKALIGAGAITDPNIDTAALVDAMRVMLGEPTPGTTSGRVTDIVPDPIDPAIVAQYVSGLPSDER